MLATCVKNTRVWAGRPCGCTRPGGRWRRRGLSRGSHRGDCELVQEDQEGDRAERDPHQMQPRPPGKQLRCARGPLVQSWVHQLLVRRHDHGQRERSHPPVAGVSGSEADREVGSDGRTERRKGDETPGLHRPFRLSVIPTGEAGSGCRSHRSDLNRRPLDYESRALPLSYGGVVVRQRLTASVERSTPWCQWWCQNPPRVTPPIALLT